MRSTTLRICFAAAAVSASVSALASPPWFVDWAHTAPFQKVLVRIYYLSNENGLNRSQSLPRVQVAYGLTRNLEINVRNEDLLKTSTKAPVMGTNDTVLGMKWRFFQDKRDNELALGYAYTLETGAPHIGGGADPQTPYLMASTTPGRFGFYSVLGETFPANNTLIQDTYYGLLSTYDIGHNWLLLGEVYGNTPTAEGARHDLEYAFGFHYTVSPTVKYFARVGHSVEGFSDLNITVGVQLTQK